MMRKVAGAIGFVLARSSLFRNDQVELEKLDTPEMFVLEQRKEEIQTRSLFD